MTGACDCSSTLDPGGLVRAGADRANRVIGALDPASVPVDERRMEHGMVFGAAFAAHLKYFGLDDRHVANDNWQRFFQTEHSALIAAAAISDIDDYRSFVLARFRTLDDPPLAPTPDDDDAMVRALLDIFDAVGTLAERLETLREILPAGNALRAVITNLIGGQLGAMLTRLIGCYRAGQALAVLPTTPAQAADLVVMNQPALSFVSIIGAEHRDWVGRWTGHTDPSTIDPGEFTGYYGPQSAMSERAHHLATHNLFRVATDAFLTALARVTGDARAAIVESVSSGGLEPHYALFVAFLRLLEYTREDLNEFSGKHLEFYYRDVLGLVERPAQPQHAHVVVQLAKQVQAHRVPEGALIKAGKDASGADRHFEVDRDLVANEGAVTRIARMYRNRVSEPSTTDKSVIFAEFVDTTAESWHPFVEKQLLAGGQSIKMARGRVGFAIASHYLWMAEGARTIDVKFSFEPGSLDKLDTLTFRSLLTTADGWLEGEATVGSGSLHIDVNADAPAVTPYDVKVHGEYPFTTAMPVLIVLPKSDTSGSDYAALESLKITGVTVDVNVKGLRTLALSNDHGPVDSSKPFLVFGAAPQEGSSLVIGSKEVCQKRPTEVSVAMDIPIAPVVHPSGSMETTLQWLSKGKWVNAYENVLVEEGLFWFGEQPDDAAVGAPDLTANTPYSTASRSGYIRLRLTAGFGTDLYPVALARWIASRSDGEPTPTAPVLPFAESLSLNYVASQGISLSTSGKGAEGQFFHVTPFGHLEPRAVSTNKPVPLFPQFRTDGTPSVGELYLGISGLRVPQDVSLLFQVVDGTADPLTIKPDPHIFWSYLHDGNWTMLRSNTVADGTRGLVQSGIVTISMPAEATTEHTVLPSGVHWLRLSVTEGADAVCRVLAVRAQAMSATAVTTADAEGAAADLPPGTLTKLDPPAAAVKSIEQPYSAFGGRPRESPAAYRTRVSERLRHKDRAVALWDYEHIVLEQFSSIYQVRCLNHTRYEPDSKGTGIYRELAPGHVTVVTIPHVVVPDQRDPLRPYTSMRILSEIETFLGARMNCFTRLHVRNPQFEPVRVDLRVRFRDGFDESYYLERLRQDITGFLSPWAFHSEVRPTFNGRIRKSVLIDFMDERTYVDYITDVRLFHRPPGQEEDGPDLEEVTGSRAISILVSVPADQHTVVAIHDRDRVDMAAGCGCGGEQAP